jgi:hypothetical protein
MPVALRRHRSFTGELQSPQGFFLDAEEWRGVEEQKDYGERHGGGWVGFVRAVRATEGGEMEFCFYFDEARNGDF